MEIAISHPWWKKKKKKISSGLNEGERGGGGARAKGQNGEKTRERGKNRPKKKKKKKVKKRKKKRVEKKGGRGHRYLRGSALNLRCDGAVHRAAPSILFPPLDLWRTMHYVNCKRAAGDRGKSNNAARVAAGLLSGIRVAPIADVMRPDVALRRR